VVGQKKGTVSAGGSAQATVDEFEGKMQEELLEMLRNASISPKGKGSQPKGTRAGVGSSDDGGDSFLSGSSSSSSSSSSDSSSASSAGVKSSSPPSAPGD
jgi:hypothetical protein